MRLTNPKLCRHFGYLQMLDIFTLRCPYALALKKIQTVGYHSRLGTPRYTFRILNLKIFGLEVSQIKVLLNIRLNELVLNVKVLYNIWFNAINSTALHLAKFKSWSYVSDLCNIMLQIPRPDSFFFEYASNKLLHLDFYIISNFKALLEVYMI